MDTDHYFNELWNQYISCRDNVDQSKLNLLQYLEEFIGLYRHLVDVNYFEKKIKSNEPVESVSPSCYHAQPDGYVVLQHLPNQLVQVIQMELLMIQTQNTQLTLPDIRFATYLIQGLVIVSRTRNEPLENLSSGLIGHIVAIVKHMVQTLQSQTLGKKVTKSLEEFLENTFYLIECLYDPCFSFKKNSQGRCEQLYLSNDVPLLDEEILFVFPEILHFYKSLSPPALHQRFLHMLGAIVSGERENALIASSPATLQILFKYLSQSMQCSDGNAPSDSDQNSESSSAFDDGTATLVLRIIVTMIHTLHNAGPGKCKVEVKTIIEEYLKFLSGIDSIPDMQLLMISFIPEILNTTDQAALQTTLLQHGCLQALKNVMINFCSKTNLDGETADKFAVQFTNIVNCLVSGSIGAKDLFMQILGTSFMLQHYKLICTSSKNVLLALLRMGLESDSPMSYSEPIKNIFIILMLFEWLPDIKQVEHQIWLSSVLSTIFLSCTTNKIIACHCKLIKKIIACLIDHPSLHQETVLNLIGLIEELGSFCLTPRQTLAFLELLRQDSVSHQHLNKYFNKLLHSLSVMAYTDETDRKPSYSFDLQEETSGITAPAIEKWGGLGFTVHAWVCLEDLDQRTNPRKRRQFYSFSNDHGVGMEGFFTPDCHLVVCVSTKKNCFSVKVSGALFTDRKWHCIQITHSPSRKMFGHDGTLQVYVDNVIKLSTLLRFPGLTGTFTLCRIGSPGHRTNAAQSPEVKGRHDENKHGNTDGVIMIENGTQDEFWGQATSLLGQIGPFLLLNDVAKGDQLNALYRAGPDMWRCHHPNGGLLEDLLPSTIVLHYEAKACFRQVCKDVSCNELHRDGRLTGHKICTWDIKNSVNCIGGMNLFTPLLEIIHLRHKSSSEDPGIELPEPISRQDSRTSLSSPYRRLAAVKNPVANFILVLTSFITSSNCELGWHTFNAEAMVQCSTIPTIGALLQKISVPLLDENLLWSIQHFVASVNTKQANGNLLLMDIYQYLLFDFRIWCLSDATTQYSHVQYLSTIIKENKKVFRSSFGVQYLIDVVKKFYCSTNSGLSHDDMRNIRVSLLGLVKYYVTDDVTGSEVLSLFKFVSATKSSDVHICEVLELIRTLWKGQSKEQLVFILSEAQYANYIYSLLCLPDYTDEVKIAVCEILILLFQSPRAAERHKADLKEKNIGFSGILFQMQQLTISSKLANLLFEAIKLTDVDGATFLALVNLLYRTDVTIRKSLCQHFLTLSYSKNTFLQECAQQKAWQEAFSKLFILEDVSANFKTPPPLLSKSNSLQEQDVFVNGSPESKDAHVQPTSSPTSSITEQDGPSSVSESDLLRSAPHSNHLTMMQPEEVLTGEELADLIVESLFLLMWRGVVGSSPSSWKERGQVFFCLNRVASANNLLRDLDDIKASILERCVEASLSDVRETSSATSGVVESKGMTFVMANENSAELVKVIYDFLDTEGKHNISLWKEKLLHDVLALFDALMVWGMTNFISSGSDWKELANIGLWLLCGCLDTGKLELVAMASAKLHNLIHLRNPSSTLEVCYLLNKLNVTVTNSIQVDNNVKEFVIPLVRDLLDKNFKRLEMGKYLSELPPTTGSATFYEDFLLYCLSSEWISFIDTCVHSNAEQYKKSTYDVLTLNMTVFWTSTTEDFMVAFHLREREKGDVQLRFRATFETDFRNERNDEEDWQNKINKSLRNQNVAVLRQWRAAKRFLASERGLWKERNPNRTFWKLSNVENFSRMRLKLTENYNFTLHEDASRLRDNLTPSEMEDKPGQEALVPPNAILASSETSKEDDSIGDEEWSMLAPNPNSSSEKQSTQEKIILTKDCQLITLMDVVEGKLEVTTTHVYFYDKSTNSEEKSGMDFKWSLSQLREVHFRRYNLRKSALELFLIDQTNYFINFHEANLRHTVYNTLIGLRPQNLLYYGTRTPQELLKASGLTQKWMHREVSNFDYLMQLNTIAGRTYNDLSQYPVFPWILKDYSSEKLDLNDPSVYRDLSKPVGVLNPKNEDTVRERYENFEDPNGVISKFHYGSHYSNAAAVLFYMLRMEPFTTLHIQLQAGRFDLADRQFHSIGATYQTIFDTTNDVKELIPEFFYMPEFLVNSNGFDLGKLQFTKEVVDDVRLPKWARSPADFIFQHRKALESDFVSNNLHHWIDLVFGYKQRGEEAVKAFNVFYYCTYEGAVDLDAISDPVLRKAVEGMINNFGQTPTQLLTDPHPKRLVAAKKDLGSRILSTLSPGDEKGPNVLEHPDQLKVFFVEIMGNGDPLVFVTVPRSQSHSFMQSGMPDAMVTVSQHGVIGLHGWLPYDRTITNYFTFEKDPAVGHSRLQKCVKGMLYPGLHLSPHLFLVTHDAKLLFIAGYWDNSIRVMTVRGKSICSFVRHLDVVTCLAMDHSGSYLMSGSFDTTSIIWKINYQDAASPAGLNVHPFHILYGHQEVVTCVLINSELDVALSSSKDGTCIMHSVRKGNYIRTIRPLGNNPHMYTVPSMAMSEEGRIVLYARTLKDAGEEKHFLHLFSINGQHLALDCLEARLGHMTICGEHLVTGDVHGLLVVRELFSFHEISRLSLCRPITCVYITKSMTHVLACLRDGKLIVVGVDKPAKSRGLFASAS